MADVEWQPLPPLWPEPSVWTDVGGAWYDGGQHAVEFGNLFDFLPHDRGQSAMLQGQAGSTGLSRALAGGRRHFIGPRLVNP